jgi:hypothetical protein
MTTRALGLLTILSALTALAAESCYERSTLSPPPRPEAPTREPEIHDAAKFHLRDGSLVVFDSWRVKGDMVSGTGRAYGVQRELVMRGAIEVRLAHVILVETSEDHVDPAIVPMAVVTGASLALTVYCLANTKACFGSCPTFYVPNAQGGWTLQAEGFSSSIARIFEDDDLDDLPDARPRDGAITVAMRNEALETHMVRRVSLQVVDGPPNGAVYRRFGDGYLSVGASVAPEMCASTARGAGAPEARDDASCSALAAKDAEEVALESDGEDLAARASITVIYPAPGKRDVALVLTARNSLMTTYVLYQMMAYEGRSYGDFQASVERGDPSVLAGLAEFSQALGGLDVSFRQPGGAFRKVGSLGYIGPIARATRALEFTVDDPSQPVEIRLDFARANWKLDAARLAPVLAEKLDAREVPAEVESAPGRDASRTAASLRGVGPYLVTTPGDSVVLQFRVTPPKEGGTQSYFLHSRGYYYEWMREEWLRDEDVGRARRYLDDPRSAFRELAPAYRAIEPSMDSVFRASRFKGTP